MENGKRKMENGKSSKPSPESLIRSHRLPLSVSLVVDVDSRRVIARVTGRAVFRPAGIAHRFEQPFNAQVAERIGVEVAADLFDRVLRGDQLLFRLPVYAVIARRDGGRATDAHVDFGGAGVAHHLDDLFRSRAAHDRIVDQDDAVALYQVAHRIEFDLHAEMPDL